MKHQAPSKLNSIMIAGGKVMTVDRTSPTTTNGVLLKSLFSTIRIKRFTVMKNQYHTIPDPKNVKIMAGGGKQREKKKKMREKRAKGRKKVKYRFSGQAGDSRWRKEEERTLGVAEGSRVVSIMKGIKP